MSSITKKTVKAKPTKAKKTAIKTTKKPAVKTIKKKTPAQNIITNTINVNQIKPKTRAKAKPKPKKSLGASFDNTNFVKSLREAQIQNEIKTIEAQKNQLEAQKNQLALENNKYYALRSPEIDEYMKYDSLDNRENDWNNQFPQISDNELKFLSRMSTNKPSRAKSDSGMTKFGTEFDMDDIISNISTKTASSASNIKPIISPNFNNMKKDDVWNLLKPYKANNHTHATIRSKKEYMIGELNRLKRMKISPLDPMSKRRPIIS